MYTVRRTFSIFKRLGVPKPWEAPPDDECGEAISELGQWAVSTPLLNYFDPSKHEPISITIYFARFHVTGEMDKCDLFDEEIPERYRCLKFEIYPNAGSGQSSELGPGPDGFGGRFSLGLGFPSDGWERVFGSHTIYERDTSIQTMVLYACDLNSEANELREQHLSRFPSDMPVSVVVHGFEKGSELPHWRPTRLRKSLSKSYWEGVCPNFVYDPT